MSLSLRPLQAPSGIVTDIGDRAWDSCVTSPKQSRKAWHASVAPLKWIQGVSALAQVDPWLKKRKGEAMDIRPPNVRTYQRFRVKLEEYLHKIKKDPEKLIREVLRRRHKFPIGYPLGPEELARWKAMERLASAAEAAEQEEERQKTIIRWRSVTRRSSTVEEAPISAAPAQTLMDESSDGSFKRINSGLKRMDSSLKRTDSRRIRFRGDRDSGEPLSPSAVPFDDWVQSSSDAGPRALDASLLIRSSPGLPATRLDADPVSPPARHGWQPIPDCDWRQHPDKPNWLYQPEKSIYYHSPSETLWQEEAAFGFAQSLDKVRIEPAPLNAGEHKSKLGLPFRSCRSMSPKGRSRRKKGCKNEDGRIGSADSGGDGPMHDALESEGWMVAEEGTAWCLNPGCPGWLHQPDEGVFYHQDTESLWCIDSDDEDASPGFVNIRRVDGGRDGLPGTPGSADS